MADNPVVAAGGDLLQRKYGPLPFWGWLVIAGGTAYAVRRYLNSRAAASEAATGEDTTTSTTDSETGMDTGSAGLGSYDFPGASYSGGGGGGGGGGGPVIDPNLTDEDQNAAWQEKAVRALVDKGVGGYQATQAISKWLRSQQISTQEQTYVSEAVALVGTPPTGIPSSPIDTGGSVPVVAPKAHSAASTLRLERVGNPPQKPGQTLAVLATWLDAQGKPITNRVLRVEQSGDGRTYGIVVNLRTNSAGQIRYNKRVISKGAGYLRVSSSPNDSIYADKVSGVLSWRT